MCGRYALALRPAEVRRYLQESHMPSLDDDFPEDDDVRQTYNFAPGYYGLVYRADVPDTGARSRRSNTQQDDSSQQEQAPRETQDSSNQDQEDTAASTQETQLSTTSHASDADYPPRYRLQAMKWGLVPFWTKRQPDYGSMMRTINCRDDSLASPGGMWASMKAKKRCIVVAQGFYEWLKKNGGREKVPHYVKRKDGQLMCFAGLWDCVRYEEATQQEKEKLYTYTIITTDSNKQLNFLHDRMPVILNNGSDEMFSWLDSTKSEWSKDLEKLLKPYDGELECYPVSKDVGKVGNNSPAFVVPVDSKENKQNIANFFGNQKAAANGSSQHNASSQNQDDSDGRPVTDGFDGENNAPKPVSAGTKHGRDDVAADSQDTVTQSTTDERSGKSQKTQSTPITSPSKQSSNSSKMRSATSNSPQSRKSPIKATDGSKKITSFFSG